MYNELLKNGGFSEFAGLSTDEKPVNGLISTGSLFTEVDTGDVYMYDAEAASWAKQFSLRGGGGGGGGGASGMVVEMVADFEDGNHRYVSTTSADEVLDAYTAGSYVVFHFPADSDHGAYEGYMTLTGYTPENSLVGDPVCLYGNSSVYLGNTNTTLTVDAQGYIESNVYID